MKVDNQIVVKADNIAKETGQDFRLVLEALLRGLGLGQKKAPQIL